jgi:hypothetical protein
MFSTLSFRNTGKGEIMVSMSTKSGRGFSLIELLISLGLGMLVIGTAVQLFSRGMAATFVVSQRAEMQQDIRAASGLLLKDLSLAGAGMPAGQIVALPATGIRPIYGCDQVGNCIPGGGIAYPCSSAAPCNPALYGIMPGWQLGITPPGSAVRSDVITVVYTDTVFALNCYGVTFPVGGAINPVTFTAPVPVPPTCALPSGLVAPQAVTDPVVGLKAGDLLLFQNTLATGSGQAIAEVSNAAGGGPTYTVNFLDGDPLQLNQSAAAAGDLAQIVGGNGTTATRIFVISYYLRLLPDPLGVGPGIPVLMRQVNGQSPVPVAENVVNMQFTYDTYDALGNLLNAQGNAGFPATPLNLIRKINVVHLTIRGQLSGAGSVAENAKGYQSFDFQTSISARNLSYQNRYF